MVGDGVDVFAGYSVRVNHILGFRKECIPAIQRPFSINPAVDSDDITGDGLV
jgi:hypothetical protein